MLRFIDEKTQEKQEKFYVELRIDWKLAHLKKPNTPTIRKLGGEFSSWGPKWWETRKNLKKNLRLEVPGSFLSLLSQRFWATKQGMRNTRRSWVISLIYLLLSSIY